MGILEDFASSVGGAAAGAVGSAAGSALGYGVDKLLGVSQSRAKDQVDQQGKLMKQQRDMNYEAQDRANEYNAPKNQMKRLKDAGLNPALMYGGGGGGGSTANQPMAIQSGSASNESERKRADNENVGLGVQLTKMPSEIKQTQANTEKLGAEKENIEAKTKTENALRENTVNKLIQDGYKSLLENFQKEWELTGKTILPANAAYNEIELVINPNAAIPQQIITGLLKTKAEAGNADASALLTSEKARGYFQELVNETNKANAEGVKAAAAKLSAEFETGIFTNWKTWVKLATEIIGGAAKIGIASKVAGK